MLQFCVLASGSSGNALYVQTDSARLLLDTGITGRQLQQRLQAAAGIGLGDLDAILLTHEHVDHVRGLQQATKLSQAPIYATSGTWHHVRSLCEPFATGDRLHVIQPGAAIQIGDITVTPFLVSHDAEEPVMYRFDTASASLAVVTDLGYMSDRVKSVIRDCHFYVLETNHDVEMLRTGRYPWSVKRRILGDKGHLSNEDAAVALADLVPDWEIGVCLAHLSEENNHPDLAEVTVRTVLQDITGSRAEQVRLFRTSRHEPTPLFTVEAPVFRR